MTNVRQADIYCGLSGSPYLISAVGVTSFVAASISGRSTCVRYMSKDMKIDISVALWQQVELQRFALR